MAKTTLSLLIITLLAIACFADAQRPTPRVATKSAHGKYKKPLDEAFDKSRTIMKKLAPRQQITHYLFDSVTSKDGSLHLKFQQTIDGTSIPIFGAEAITHFDSEGNMIGTTDRTTYLPITGGIKPRLDESDAIMIAATVLVNCSNAECLTQPSHVDLIGYNLFANGTLVLAYKVLLFRLDGTEQTTKRMVIVDANTGIVLKHWEQMFAVAAAGSGSSLYSGTVSFDADLTNGVYTLSDPNTKTSATDMKSGTSGGGVPFSQSTNSWTSANAKAGVDAFWAAQKVLKYYKQVHGRTGVKNQGYANLPNQVHYGNAYNNAFWSDSTQSMTYGDGDGSALSPLVSLDVVAHEITHGITSATAGLVYSGQSGGLNEATSDIFAACVESWVRGAVSSDTWKIGEQIYTPATAGDALRYMDNPRRDGASINHLSQYTSGMDVHYSSGLPNYVFYLMSIGGTHPVSSVTVTGMGINNASSIWYRALTAYWTSSTDFSGARAGCLNAAAAIFGTTSAQYKSVGDAWAACGVGASSGGATPANTIRNPSFTNGTESWTMGGGAIVQDGYGYIGGYNNAAESISQSVLIGANKTISFRYRIATSETTTTIIYDKFYLRIVKSDSTYTTLVAWSNLNKNNDWATSPSYSLSAFAGQTVTVQFSGTTDSSEPTSFLIDDIVVG